MVCRLASANAGILLTGPLGTNVSEIEIYICILRCRQEIGGHFVSALMC